ncbi:MAG: TlpA family protein disulfide reductase [Bacteroidales bacterium]|nr:TlpA family protein disulfide reductase [Candidatus Physcousia equi]
MTHHLLPPLLRLLSCLVAVTPLFGCLLASSCTMTQEEAITPADNLVHVGDPLPYFEITMNDDSLLKTSDLSGKPTLIVFFSTLCKDCQRELPTLNRRYLDHAADTTFVAIARQQTPDVLADYWAAHQLSLPYSAQPDRSVYHLFARKGIPRIYISDAHGIVCKVVEAW